MGPPKNMWGKQNVLRTVKEMNNQTANSKSEIIKFVSEIGPNIVLITHTFVHPYQGIKKYV